MPNRLAGETSPYLLQHCDNPVDWYPWGEEALARSGEEDLPILLSVGYSACHWCHVMERESFEDDTTAAYMNEHFVCIKVDREERPDIDDIYMEAVQSITGQGGWPMTVFLDPEGVPFYGGTYFPPEPARGMPSFIQVMEAVVEAFTTRREEIGKSAVNTRRNLAAIARLEPDASDLTDDLLLVSVDKLRASADQARGGFGGAPKFPPASAIDFLLTRGERDITQRTLDAMAAGGIYDQIGGGFSRYAVDPAWRVPHFEKMLYDNALLARTYLHGWQVLGIAAYRRICEETLDWALREMRGPEGGFYSALDADSEGVEGRFYVWTPEEARAVLAGFDATEADATLAYLGITETGNFEGKSIPHLAAGLGVEPPERFGEARSLLRAARADRVWPGLDDKRLTSWNALMISALAEAGAVLGRADYLDAARECADFLLGAMRDDGGHLLRTYKDGVAHLNAYLEDHAYLLEALLTLYEATFDDRFYRVARETAETMIDRFADPENGGFFTTSSDHEQLIARRKDVGDHPIPAGNSAAAFGLLRLGALSGESSFDRSAEGAIRLFHPAAERHPEAFAHLLRAIDFHVSRTREVALIGADPGVLGDVAREKFRPRQVLAGGEEGAGIPELLAGRTRVSGRPAAYVCENFTCRMPVTEPEELRRLLDGED